jgi:hypothetical protein
MGLLVCLNVSPPQEICPTRNSGSIPVLHDLSNCTTVGQSRLVGHSGRLGPHLRNTSFESRIRIAAGGTVRYVRDEMRQG